MSILTRIREARRRRQAIRDLRAMPTELLFDIGIEPDQIETAVSTGARMEAPDRRISAFAPHPASTGAWPYAWGR